MIGRATAGSGGAFLHVTGSASQPSSVPNNTIWIETSDRVTGYYIQQDEPSAPKEGEAWITYGKSADSDMNISQLEVFRLKPASAKQYLSGSWVTKTFKTYYNGSWSG